MKEPPASGPVSPPPRALRPAELQVALRKLADTGSLPEPAAIPAPRELPAIEPLALDLLAGVASDEPVSTPPPAVRPWRASGPRRRRGRSR